MKKYLFVTHFFALYSVFPCFGQSLDFQYQLPESPLPTIKDEILGVKYGATKFADLDNDGDDDLINCGEGADEYLTTVYMNDGSGNFTILPNNIDGIYYGDIDIADVDLDGDLDLFICGENNLGYFSSKLYQNDGTGIFIENTSTVFEPMGNSNVEFFDYENDGDFDLLMTGANGFTTFAKLYLNDGTGSFSFLPGTPFNPVYDGELTFFDYDNDNDNDLLLCGQYNSNRLTKLYENLGSGNFVENTSNSFVQLAFGDIEVADVDSDNDLDFLISGTDNSSAKVTELYINNGGGVFLADLSLSVTDLFHSALSFFDFDNDNDKDLFIVGMDALSNRHAELYSNNGNGAFTLVDDTTFYNVYLATTATSDVNGDGYIDLFVTGHGDGFYFNSTLYMGSSSGQFREASGCAIVDLSKNSFDYADIDNDNDKDLVVSGLNNHGVPVTKIYLNDGNGNFSPVNSNLVQVYWGVVKFADIDNDGDADLLISGSTTLAPGLTANTNLYLNDGAGNFTEISSAGISNVYYSDADFGDVDNDGDLDLYLVGRLSGSSNSSELYYNNGSGSFTASGFSFLDIAYASVNLVDINGDSNLDIVQAGQNGSWGSLDRYLNDGTGNFTSIGSPYDGVRYCSLDFADVNADGYVDMMTTGLSASGNNAKLYLNNADGTGNFTLVTGTPFTPVRNSSILFTDIDMDNDQDLILTGLAFISPAVQVSKLYLNDGTGSFSEVFPDYFIDVEYGDIAVDDFDSDGDQDILIAGNNGYSSITRMYKNTICFTENILVADQNLCDGDSTMLFLANSYDSYLWSNGSTASFIYVSDSTDYYVIASNIGGCTNNSNTVSINIFDCTCPPDTIIAQGSYICQGDSVLLEVANVYDNYLWSNGQTTSTIYVTDSADYSVIVSNFGGCMNGSDTVSVLVYDCTCPDETLMVSCSAICNSDSTELFLINTFDTYLWSNGATTSSIFIQDSLDYSVVVSNFGGCLTGSDTLSIDVYDCSLLIDTINYMIDSCIFDTVNVVMSFITVNQILNDTVYITWNFVSDIGSTFTIDTAYYFPVNGLYNISLTVVCGRATEVTFYALLDVTHMSNLNNVELPDLGFLFHPNPVLDYLIISFNENYDEAILVTITDMKGRVIYMQQMKEGENIISLQNLSSGMYVLNVISEGRIDSRKILKQ